MESANLQKPMGIAMFGGVVVSFAPILYALSDANPLTGAFFRMAYAIPFLLLIIWFRKAQDSRSTNTRLVAVIAGFAFSLDFLAYHSTVDWIGTGIGTLIGNSQVIIVTLMSWWLFGERPNLSILISLPIVMIGLVLISGVLDDNPYGEYPVRGVIAGVFTAIFYSAFLIIYRFANRELAPAVNLQFDSTVGCALGLLILSFLPLQSIYVEPIDFEPRFPTHGWLLALALLSQVMGWLAIAYSLPRLPAAYTSFAILLQPTFTIIWGIILLSESPSLQQAIGMFLILGSIIAVTTSGTVKDDEK
ncbi:MAG: DMT family transporter [Candidatus Poseidoniales archaeon]|tara:strand:- start:1118 stop:2029 length:912 start_codon:yes stop_codon:yes gene_type:complete